MLRTMGFPAGIDALSLFSSDAGIKSHARYVDAKAGNAAAALDLVIDVAVSWLYGHSQRFEPSCLFVAPHAKEATGDNAIPQTLAAVCATMFRGHADTDVVQTDRVYHTGASAMERMALRASFEGVVCAGARYVLVDDVLSLGGTLAELGNFIQQKGGVVEDVVVLANAGRNPALVPERKDIRLIQERFSHEFIQIFGIDPAALTANEARYLVGFKSADALRDSLAKARKEIHLRLRSKGIASPFGPVEFGGCPAQTLKPSEAG